MNWRVIRYTMLFILIILNLGLFMYNRQIQRQRYVVPETRIALVKEQYQREGYSLPEELPKEQYPMARLILKKQDLEERVDGFWNEAYEKSYMIGSKVLYTCGTEVLTVDRDRSSLHYIQKNPEWKQNMDTDEELRLAMAFARILMQEEDLKLIQEKKNEDGARIYTICQEYDGKILFCNGISITIFRGVVTEAYMQQYQVAGYEEEELFIYPIDEVLFACMDLLGENPDIETLQLYYGYDLRADSSDFVYGEPHILLCKESGGNLLVNQYTVDFNILQYR